MFFDFKAENNNYLKNPNILLSFSIPSLLPPPSLSHPEAQEIDELAASHEDEPTQFVLNVAKGKHSKGFSHKSLEFTG